MQQDTGLYLVFRNRLYLAASPPWHH